MFIKTLMNKHKPEEAKNDPICPAGPLLQHKQRQTDRCTAMSDES